MKIILQPLRSEELYATINHIKKIYNKTEVLKDINYHSGKAGYMQFLDVMEVEDQHFLNVSAGM